MVAVSPDLQEATVNQLQRGLENGDFTSVDLVKAYLARISEVNDNLKAVISVSPTALVAAKRLDNERSEGKVRSLLHGIPIAIKDNIATDASDGMPTTAGSFALLDATVVGDADAVARLREAGAIMLCKTNLCEFASFRGVAAGAWSPVGGQVTSPYYPGGHPSGSSCGSAVAAAVGLAAVTIGTETGGSIISPSSRTAIVGIRPTVGLVSQDGVVPITKQRDAVGPMCRTLEDAAIVLEIISGRHNVYRDALGLHRLDGIRLLVPTNLTDWKGNSYLHFGQKERFLKGLRILEELGADIIEAALPPKFISIDRSFALQQIPMENEFVYDLREHLRTAYKVVPSGVKCLKTLTDFIKNDPRERPGPYQTCNVFYSALKQEGLQSSQYKRAMATVDRAKLMIPEQMKKYSAEAMVLYSATCDMWSHAGYPQVTIPLGVTDDNAPVWRERIWTPGDGWVDTPDNLVGLHPNQPYGITFAGSAYSEETLIRIAHAFEQATQVRKQVPTYPQATPRTQIRTVQELLK